MSVIKCASEPLFGAYSHLRFCFDDKHPGPSRIGLGEFSECFQFCGMTFHPLPLCLSNSTQPFQASQLVDERTLFIPDRPGNNRINGMKNIIVNPKVGIIFLVLGVNETFRVNGTAHISVAPALLSRFLR